MDYSPPDFSVHRIFQARMLECDEDLREPLVRRQGSQVSMRVARAQLVKNPPAMQEILVRFLGQEDLLEKG